MIVCVSCCKSIVCDILPKVGMINVAFCYSRVFVVKIAAALLLAFSFKNRIFLKIDTRGPKRTCDL